jgi:dodecin
MTDNVYKVIDLVGSSSAGIQPAIENAISRANETLTNLNWFEVKEIRGNLEDGEIRWYQVAIRVGFRVVDRAGMQAGD